MLTGVASAQQQQPPAQSPPAAGSPATPLPPIGVNGWRFEKRGDFFQFFCNHPRCGPHAAVSYRLYAPDFTMSYAKFRQNQDEILPAIRQRAAPGTTISVLEIKGDEGSGPPRIFTIRRLSEFANGTKEYRVSTTLLGRTYAASLISTSDDETAASANSGVFIMGLMLFINMEKPQTMTLDPYAPPKK
jgi:hypothetical protein